VVDMAHRAVAAGAEALFISCTNLPTYDVIPQLEAELRLPVLSANQVTMWAALRRMGAEAVGPYQALLDPTARSGAGPVLRMPLQGTGAMPEVALAGQPLGDADHLAEVFDHLEAPPPPDDPLAN